MFSHILEKLNPGTYQLSKPMKSIVVGAAFVSTVALLYLLKGRGMLSGVGYSIPQAGLIAGVSGTAVVAGAILVTYLRHARSAPMREEKKQSLPIVNEGKTEKVEVVTELKTIKMNGVDYVAWEEIDGHRMIVHGGKQVCLLGKFGKNVYHMQVGLFNELPKGNYYFFKVHRDDVQDHVLQARAKEAKQIYKGEKAIPIQMVEESPEAQSQLYLELKKGVPVITWAHKMSISRPQSNYFIPTDAAAEPTHTNEEVTKAAKERLKEYFDTMGAKPSTVTHDNRQYMMWEEDLAEPYSRIQSGKKTVYLFFDSEKPVFQIQKKLFDALPERNYYLYKGSGRLESDSKAQMEKARKVFGEDAESAIPIRIIAPSSQKYAASSPGCSITWGHAPYTSTGIEYIHADGEIKKDFTNMGELRRFAAELAKQS